MQFYDVIEEQPGAWCVRAEASDAPPVAYSSRADAIAGACHAAKTHYQEHQATTALRLIHPPDEAEIIVRYLSPAELDALCWFGDATGPSSG